MTTKMLTCIAIFVAMLSCSKEPMASPTVDECANVVSYASHYTFAHKLIKRELSFDWKFCGELLKQFEGKRNDTLCESQGYVVLDYKIVNNN